MYLNYVRVFVYIFIFVDMHEWTNMHADCRHLM